MIATAQVPWLIMRPDDIGSFRTPARPQLHPDGHRVAFDVTQMDVAEDRYLQRIWLWDVTARPFTSGPGDKNAKWSPDGTQLAFLRKPKEGPAQLAVMPVAGGEAEVITDFSLGVSEFEWSPSGESIAVVATTWTEGWDELDDEERNRKPRRIDHAVYRRDNHGWSHDRRAHVWLVDPSGAKPAERLTDCDADEQAPAWAPDGSAVAFLAVHDDPHRMTPGFDIVEVDLATRTIGYRHRQGGWWSLSFRSDGRLLAVGDPDPLSWPGLTSLWMVDGETLHDLTGHLDRSIWSFLLAPVMARPVWLDEEFLIGLEDSGRVHVVRVGADGTATVQLGGDRHVTGFTATGDAGRLVFTATTPTSPGELYERTGDGGAQPLTDLNGEFLSTGSVREPEHFRLSTDEADIDVWVVLPDGDAQVPVLLNIHGGPAAQYGFAFFDEFQVYAGAGYGVVACNPRGSSGRGVEFLQAVAGDGWGVVDVADVTAAFEAALARYPRLDGARAGIMGGSYGGFLTAWMLGQTDRFSSAVVERALINWESFAGTSDIAPHFSSMYLDAVPPADRDVLAAASPATFADRITTPTLILHSENDFRCPIEQAEQLFMTLLRNQVDTVLLRFPDESHELSRSGAPRHRIERFEAILDWHGRYLDP